MGAWGASGSGSIPGSPTKLKMTEFEPNENINPHIIPVEVYESMTPDELTNRLISAEYIDITGGFPAKDASQLFWTKAVLADEHDIHRLPIIGVTQEDKTINTYMLTSPSKYGKLTHQYLASLLGIQEDQIGYTTSLEATMKLPSSATHNLKLDVQGNDWDIMLQRGSDYYPTGLTYRGEHIIQEIFEQVQGVSFK